MSRITHRLIGRDSFRIGIVDLMAQTAHGLSQTQFAQLIGPALRRSHHRIELHIVNLDPSVSWPRPAGTRADWDLIASFDAVIVTGAEPRTAEFSHDPSFALVEKILAATASRAVSTVLSCLSAHAALEHLYSVYRRRLPEKRVGVPTHVVVAHASPLTAGLPDLVAMPHSRWHTVHRADLTTAGVIPLLLAGGQDWAVATSPDGIRYVFLQGHPEYFADTLLREYRRDVRRFLGGVSDAYPAVPTDYLAPSCVEALTAFAAFAQRNRSTQALAEFPEIRLDRDFAQNWTMPSEAFAANWTYQVTELTHV